MVEETISVGARYKFTDNKRNRDLGVANSEFIVTDIFIDEDNNGQLTIVYDKTAEVSLGRECVSVTDIRTQVQNDNLTRINTDHEAYKIREKAGDKVSEVVFGEPIPTPD